MSNKKKMNRNIILLGEGKNQHTLYGNFAMAENHNSFAEISVKETSTLQHEEPSGSFAEHERLQVDAGIWVMGKQVEYNPFNGTISQVWD